MQLQPIMNESDSSAFDSEDDSNASPVNEAGGEIRTKSLASIESEINAVTESFNFKIVESRTRLHDEMFDPTENRIVGSLAHIKELSWRAETRYRFPLSYVDVLRNHFPATDMVPYETKEFVVTLSGSAEFIHDATESLPMLLTCRCMDAFGYSLKAETTQISLVVHEHEWDLVSMVVSAFFEFAI